MHAPHLFAAFVAAALLFTGCQSARKATTVRLPENYRLLHQSDFSGPDALEGLVMTDPAAWRISDDHALELHGASNYEPAVRSPLNIALIGDRRFGDFILEVEMQQTGREYGHRDLCLFYGVRDPSHFYYTHMASVMDDHAHNIFIVNGAPRTKISTTTTDGVDWGQEEWHQIRIERQMGEIRVYFDDFETPIMTATDDTFPEGHIGFGSFDDTGKFRNVRIWGESAVNRPADFYRPAR